jgi:murein DD-endopeptidase MepM/ murein hydrolase activator NlpD
MFRALVLLVVALARLPPGVSGHAQQTQPVTEPSPDGPLAIDLQARSRQPGEVLLVDIAVPFAAARVELRAFDRDYLAFRVRPGAWRAIVGVDLDTVPGTYWMDARATGASAAATGRGRIVIRPKRFPTRTLKVDPAFVSPPPAELARIAAEAAHLTELWASSAAEPLWTGPFQRPVPQPANSAFGTRSIFNGQPRSPHGGADFLSPRGTPVRAPSAGRVLLADDLYYTGGSIVLDHGAGLVSLFAHLSKRLVRTGDQVAAGQIIGEVGSTGRVTGPHLHWTLRAHGARVDPLSLLSVLGQ